MRKLLVRATVLAVVMAGMPGVASADPALDQSFTSPSNLGALINECCAYIGQTFTAGRTGVLSGVNIDVTSSGTSLPLNVAIRAVDSSGLPNSTVLGETVLDSSSSPLTRLITFPQLIDVIAETQYAIVVNYQGAPPAGPGNVLGAWSGASGDAYPRGEQLLSFDNGASWSSPDPGYDLHFQTYVQEVPLFVGSQQVQPNVDSNPAGTAEAFRYSAPGSGLANQLSVYLDSTNAATNVLVGLYTNTKGGNPSVLLTSGAITKPIAGSWNIVTVPATRVRAGTDYWLAVLSPVKAGTVKFRDLPDGYGGPTQTSAQHSLKSLPHSWTTGTRFSNSPASLYATG